MEKIILFVSKYSEENYLLSKHICLPRANSCAFFFGCKENSFSGVDYSNTITRSEDEFSSKAFASELSHLEENLAVELYSFIQNLTVQPDIIIFKGSVAETLPLVSIKEFSGLDIPAFCLLEYVKSKYSYNEICILQSFESILLMDDIESNLEEFCKTRVIFPGFISSKIKSPKDFDALLTFPVMNEKIVFTNNKNYKQICDEIDNSGLSFNICSYEGMSEIDISVMSMLNSEIFDLTENKYFPIIISKMGKKVKGPKVFEQDNEKNILGKGNSNIHNEDFFKDFFRHIEKEIYHDLKNHLKEPVVIKANTVAM